MSSTKSSYNIRAVSAQIIFDVLEQGTSLSTALVHCGSNIKDNDRGLIQEICFGVMRVLPELEFYIQNLMKKPFTGKNRIVHYLLLVGVYQIVYTRVPAHASVGETVNAATILNKQSLKGVVNGVLRGFLREQDQLKQAFRQQNNTTLHPTWLVNRIKQAYPNNWQAIVDANNQKPPMWLRVNHQQYSTVQYQQKLTDVELEVKTAPNIDSALQLLTPTPVSRLPEFADGAVTVQDLSAQYAAYLLEPKNGETILDMCAAPGGKTTHILELAPESQVMAVDIDQQRLKRVYENLARLKCKAEVKIGDGLSPEKWLNSNQKFDKILLDAPCSATGVIRRHPDIKWLRRDSDIAELVQLQYQILTRIWSYLKPNGILIYATCSILPDENRQQIERFIAENNDVKLCEPVIQLLPTNDGGDGFFYAKLQKLE